MSAQTARKVDRHKVLQYMADLIEQSPDGTIEIASTELADMFGVQGPTMDYHLKKLVEAGELIQLDRRGQYNRKIYKLPENSPFVKKSIKISGPEDDAALADLFAKLGVRPQKDLVTLEPKTESVPKESSVPVQAAQPTPEPAKEVETTAPVTALADETVFGQTSGVTERPVNLDERVREFLEQMESIPTAQEILKKDDREIMAVLTESIHQAMSYLRSLSDQLSTVQNLKLVQEVIDDRNRQIQAAESMREELEMLRQELQILRSEQAENKFAIDVDVVRKMHQNILATLDRYCEQKPQALALSVREFRKDMSEQITDLVRYILNLEG
ncbi:winged helix-turn-helix domain-containing protein [Alicyclobacillus shizuokensis]|uniref:winged helix-turn-helix domain-containing protein n=1 Tax=Alicyclobacillus shizuokensis TaxID=392014 RepID=UPI0008361B4B|nr:winged helix-turn-helix domain-containing protein [Alicyclobacillus shizuokensis]